MMQMEIMIILHAYLLFTELGSDNFFHYFNSFLEQNLKIPPRIYFCSKSKFKFSRELQQDNERLNELTLLIVNSGVVPNVSSL